MGRRGQFAKGSRDSGKQAASASSDPATEGLENARSFVGRYGAVLAAANLNIWPHALLLEADDGVPHWKRIGLDRNELFFLLVALSHYYSRENWPALAVERLARWLDLTERRVQQIKNTLIDDQYLMRIPRQDRDGNRRPDGLDFTPLFALLEACLLRYHPDLITRDAAPVWLPAELTAHPLDPDEFGQQRQERRHQSPGRRANEGAPAHPPGEMNFTRGVQPASGDGVKPVTPEGSNPLHHAGAAGFAGSETHVQKATSETLPRSEESDLEGDRAGTPPGISPEESQGENPERETSPVRSLPINERLRAIVEGYARAFRDDSPERSIETAHHLWWNAHLPLATFADLLDQAALVTRQTISAGRIRRGEAGARQAMPYFFRVLTTLCAEALAERERAERA